MGEKSVLYGVRCTRYLVVVLLRSKVLWGVGSKLLRSLDSSCLTGNAKGSGDVARICKKAPEDGLARGGFSPSDLYCIYFMDL